MPKAVSETKSNQGITKRLDALIRLYIEANKPDKKMKLSEGEAIRLLNSVDLTPTEIAKILGKKRTDVSYALYSRKEKREKENKQPPDPEDK